MSSSAILSIKDEAVTRKTVIALLKYLVDKDLYDLFAGLRRLLYDIIENDFILLSNVTVSGAKL